MGGTRLIALLAGSAVLAACAPDAPTHPDVVVVTWDTVRADHVGPPSPSAARATGASATPRWDALARTGVAFSDARTPVPITLPAHTSLFTGLFPNRHGVRNNGVFRAEAQLTTLAERFAEAGYATAAFVSAAVLRARYGLAQGFDVYDDAVDPRPGQTTVAARRGDATVDAAIAWLAKAAPDRPVFLWLHLFDPHRVWDAPAPWSGRFDPYRAEIAFADAQTGRLLDALADAGRLERAVVALTSDHGEGLGEHGEGTHSFFAYDSTARVPLLLWLGRALPVERRPGAAIGGPASLVDLAPTLLELAGLAPMPVDGRSLVAQLRGEPVPPRLHPLESVVPELDYGAAPVFGLLSEAGEVWFDLPRRERYEPSRDPGQRHNLYRPADAPTADALFSRWTWNWPPESAAAPLELDADARRELAALGYVAGTAPRGRGGPAAPADPKDRIALFDFLTLQAELLTAEAGLERARALGAEYGSLLGLERFRIDALSALGRSRDAIALLEEAARAHPEAKELREELAARRARLEEQRALARAIRATLTARPDHPGAERDLALTLHRLQEFDEAETLYRRVLERRPGDSDTRANLARLLMTRGAYAEALALVEEGRSQPDHAPALGCIAGRILGHYLGRPAAARPALLACREAGLQLSARDLAVLHDGQPPR